MVSLTCPVLCRAHHGPRGQEGGAEEPPPQQRGLHHLLAEDSNDSGVEQLLKVLLGYGFHIIYLLKI